MSDLAEPEDRLYPPQTRLWTELTPGEKTALVRHYAAESAHTIDLATRVSVHCGDMVSRSSVLAIVRKARMQAAAHQTPESDIAIMRTVVSAPPPTLPYGSGVVLEHCEGCMWPTGHDGTQHLHCNAERTTSAESTRYCAEHLRASLRRGAPQ